jgi:hypothetical protein
VIFLRFFEDSCRLVGDGKGEYKTAWGLLDVAS